MKNIINQSNSAFLAILNQPQNTVIVTHVNPDGDAIGSSLALRLYLQKKGHQVQVITPNEFPLYLRWMNGAGEICDFQKNKLKGQEYIKNASLLICADFNAIDRIKEIQEAFNISKATRFLIDHHIGPPDLYDYAYHSVQTSSTAELVYRFIRDMGDVDLIDVPMSECIMTGIMTDTGCFNHNDSAITYEVVASLMKKGIDKGMIFRNVYNNYSADRMKLIGHAISNKLVVYPELHTAYMSLSQEELKQFNFVSGDTEDLVNMPFSIKGIHFTALFVEKKDLVKLSLRSHGDFSVNTLCAKYFKGGGHKNASGGESHVSLQETIAIFEQLIKDNESDLRNLS